MEATVDQLVSRWSQLADNQMPQDDDEDDWVDRYAEETALYMASGKADDPEDVDAVGAVALWIT